MNKNFLLTGALALLTLPTMAQGISVFDTGRKWDTYFDYLIKGNTVQRIAAQGARSVTPQENVTANVSVSNAEAVAEFVKDAGYEADVITRNLIVVSVPANFIPSLGEREDVLYINEPRQYAPLMNNARVTTHVNEVVTGEGLETPYTGKGVVVGIIDQGFEYDHPAFSNRVVRWGSSASGGSFRTTKPSSDRLDANGHATHVSNIAAGSPVGDCPYYGIATGADLIQVSSDFYSSSVLKQTKAIKDYAEGNGQPWVVNMSFGSILGPHDGTTEFDQGMSELTNEGGILVAAMGNSGGSKLHAFRTIESESTPVYLYMRPDADNSDKVIMSEVWSTANDGTSHLTITPIIVYGGKRYELAASKLGSSYSSGINAYNKRQYAQLQAYSSTLLSAAGLSTSLSSSYYVMWEVQGAAGESFHAWVSSSSYAADFYAKGSPYSAKSGDDEYLVGEGAASVPNAIAVASYNNPIYFTSWDGSSLDYSSVGREGRISNFSSKGPQIVERPKPAVSAPGGVIISAFSKNSDDFDASRYDIAQSVTVNGKKYYYGVMSGTSMASPVVTGIVALWLEANPKLTYEQILEIFKETSTRSNTETGQADENGWNNEAGYGKINAYEGLKKALEYAKSSGINEALNTTSPVTIQKTLDQWRVLFNNDESYADIRLYSVDGSLVKSQHLDSPRRSEEHVVSFTGLAPGIYMINVSTTAQNITRKVIVK